MRALATPEADPSLDVPDVAAYLGALGGSPTPDEVILAHSSVQLTHLSRGSPGRTRRHHDQATRAVSGQGMQSTVAVRAPLNRASARGLPAIQVRIVPPSVARSRRAQAARGGGWVRY